MKANRFFLLCTLILCTAGVASAQKKVKVSAPPALDSLVTQYSNKNKSQQTIDGYRIQLFSGADRANASNLRNKFTSEFPDIPAYLVYQQPHFKLRVGDFRTYMEANLFYLQLQKEYSQLLIVPDKINLPKL